ncbi:MAG: 3-deoxy-D-manno-octulosonic acid transferase [Wenzhouxiangellaceae bacterium]
MRSLWFPIYRLLAAAASPLAARRLARACADNPLMLARQPERRGHVSFDEGELWVHVASVGELNAAERLVCALGDERRQRIVLTTLTHTAAEQARMRFASRNDVRHVFAPLDTVASVSRWLDHTRPRALILVETEIWPVMLDQCRRRLIPVAMVNARISSRAMRRYRRFAGLFGKALAVIDPVLCQGEADRRRFATLGVDDHRIAVTGNLKYDFDALDPPIDELLAWQRRWSGRPVWVAGSTHIGEEPLVGKAQRELLRRYPDALLIVVPRHPERGQEVLAELKQAGLTACMVKDWRPDARVQALVIDRIGVLGGLYQVTDACFIGGSLVEGIGGHNLIEPALARKPILTGPYTFDQQAAAEGLEAADGLVRVDSAAALADKLAKILEDPQLARQLGANANGFAKSQRGALATTMNALAGWLRTNSPVVPVAVTDRAD